MENDIKEILFVFALAWIMSLCVSLLTLSVYWFGFEPYGWNRELTLLLSWNLGILGIMVSAVLISIFLHRFEIVKKT